MTFSSLDRFFTFGYCNWKCHRTGIISNLQWNIDITVQELKAEKLPLASVFVDIALLFTSMGISICPASGASEFWAEGIMLHISCWIYSLVGEVPKVLFSYILYRLLTLPMCLIFCDCIKQACYWQLLDHQCITCWLLFIEWHWYKCKEIFLHQIYALYHHSTESVLFDMNSHTMYNSHLLCLLYLLTRLAYWPMLFICHRKHTVFVWVRWKIDKIEK